MAHRHVSVGAQPSQPAGFWPSDAPAWAAWGAGAGVPVWSQGVDLIQLRLRRQLGPHQLPSLTTCGSETQKGEDPGGGSSRCRCPHTALLVYLFNGRHSGGGCAQSCPKERPGRPPSEGGGGVAAGHSWAQLGKALVLPTSELGRKAFLSSGPGLTELAGGTAPGGRFGLGLWCAPARTGCS